MLMEINEAKRGYQMNGRGSTTEAQGRFRRLSDNVQVGEQLHCR